MRKVFLAAVFVLVVLLLGFAFLGIIKRGKKESFEEKGSPIVKKDSGMKITSPSFQENAFIPSKYTCDGENINPPLAVSDVSADAKSLALIVDDPDAPVGTFVHWLVWNIPPSVSEIKEGNLSEGSVQGTNDFGKREYGGPCPPSGTHRYFFRLYALSQELNLPEGARREELEKAMEGKIIDTAELVGRYSKK